MKYRKLSPTGDFVFGNSLKDFYIDVPAAPGQAVLTRLKLWQGEWFLDNSVGTPYMVGVIGKHTQQMADTTVQDQITGTEGVTGIASFSSQVDPDTRQYSAVASINTEFGPTPIQIANYVNF